MKKLFLLALLVPALLVSCSDKFPKDDIPVGKNGSIQLSLSLASLTQQTPSRAPEMPVVADFTVVLTGSEGPVSMAWPTDGLITNLKPGAYTVKVTTHTTGMPDSGFGKDYWEGEANATVNAGATAVANITASLQNGGVYFVYDKIPAGVDVKVEVTDVDNNKIEYTDRTEEVAYFVPGNDVEVRVTIDGMPAKMEGHDFMTLAIQANRVWKVSLENPTVGENGDMEIEVKFEDVIVDEVTWGVDEGDDPGPGPDPEEVELLNFDITAITSMDDFDAALEGCLTIDKDGDTATWNTIEFSDGDGVPTGLYALASASFLNSYGPLFPENYLIFPGVALAQDGKINFAVQAQDAGYPAEKFKIVISDSEFTIDNCSSATALHTHTLADGNAYSYEVEIPASYNGKTIYVGICHFDCTDQYMLKLLNFSVSHTTTTREAASVVKTSGSKWSYTGFADMCRK